MRDFLASLGVGLLVFASFASSTHYSLNSYSVGPAGTNNAHSSTYYTQSTGGEISGNGTVSGHFNGSSGGVQAEQLAVPQAPTVSNNSGTYYNELLVTLNDNAGTNSYPSDVTFSIGVSTANCFTSACINSSAVQFVQTGGSLGSSQFYQSYSAWGSGSGTTITGLSPNTTYYVAVAAKQGTFTNTEYGASTSAATGAPSVTFSLTPNTLSFSNILPNTVYTSSTVSFTLATNADYGGNIYNAGKYGGLYSPSRSYTLPSATTNLATAQHGFGLQGASVGQTSGGPMAIDSPYNGTGNSVGVESTTYTPIFTTTAPVTGGTATMNMQAKASGTDPASTDYQEIMTFVAAASF